MIYYFIWIIYFSFILFLYLLNIKIKIYETKIIKEFKEKNNQIPSLFEVTDGYIVKHDQVFKEILQLNKKDFLENIFYSKLKQKSKINTLIHKELNFIFRVSDKHPKLNKNYKFLYIKDIIIEKNNSISEKLTLYKKIIKKYNILITIKNLTIIWILFPIKKI